MTVGAASASILPKRTGEPAQDNAVGVAVCPFKVLSEIKCAIEGDVAILPSFSISQMCEYLFTPKTSRFPSPLSLKHTGATDLNASYPYLYMVFIFSFLQTILLLTNRPKIIQCVLQVGGQTG